MSVCERMIFKKVSVPGQVVSSRFTIMSHVT